MNKDDLVASIAQKMNISIAEATGILDRLLSVISEALERGESVDLSGFGKFSVQTRAAHSDRNPHSDETIQIRGDRFPVFSPDEALMDLIGEVQSAPEPVSKSRERTTRGIDLPATPPASEPPSEPAGTRTRGGPMMFPSADDPVVEESAPPATSSPGEPPRTMSRGDPMGFPSGSDPTAEESGPPATETDKRRVNAYILFAGMKRKTFVRGADNTVRCWIGLPEEGVASSNENIPTMSIPEKGLQLTVQILWDDRSDSQEITLPANRTARTGDCDLQLQIPEDTHYVSAELAFRYRGSVFEMIRLEAFVLSEDEPEEAHHKLNLKVQMSQRDVIEIKDRHEIDSTIVWGEDKSQVDHPGDTAPPALRVFGRGDPKHYDLSDADKTINWLNKELFITEASLVNKRAEAPGDSGGDRLDEEDPDVIRILRTLAEHGTELYNQLTNADFEDPGERIQLINTEPKEYVPIEFVYDRGYPASDATVCIDGVKALSDEHAIDCPVCKPAHELTARERDNAKIICPFGFWSLKKIIERRDPKTMSNDANGTPSVPRAQRRSLPAIDRALFASSYRVPEEEQEKTEQALANSIEGSKMAISWTDWKNKLEEEKPPLLVVLPHHHVEDNQDFLEIGGKDLEKSDRLLARGRMTDLYVNPDETDPGPIVILLGCRTAAGSETGYVQLARRFQHLSTSIVVGTLGKILGRHAAPVARELVAELVSVTNPEADFGTIMRQVRRRMLGKGYLMALCIVALGDAEWRLTPRQD